MYNIVYLPTARRQIENAILYIARELNAPDTAERLLQEINDQIKALGEMPYRFPVYPTLYAMKREIRSIPVNGYIIFYIVREEQKTVEIWRFLHQRQQKERP